MLKGNVQSGVSMFRKIQILQCQVISQGYYKTRVFYGNDWNPILTNSCGRESNFESDVSLSEFDET